MRKDELISLLEVKFDYYSARSICANAQLGDEITDDEVSALAKDIMDSYKGSQDLVTRILAKIGQTPDRLETQAVQTAITCSVDVGSQQVVELGSTGESRVAYVESVGADPTEQKKYNSTSEIKVVEENGAEKAVDKQKDVETTGSVLTETVASSSVIILCTCYQEGDKLVMVGANPELGEWQVKKGLSCEGQDGIFQSPNLFPGSYEFKLAIVRGESDLVWEQGDNHVVTLDSDQSVEIQFQE